MIGRQLFKNAYYSLCKSHMKSLHSKVEVIGVPFGNGQRKSGTENSPQLIRESGVFKGITELGYNVKDHGDVTFDKLLNNDTESYGIPTPRSAGAAMKKIADAVEKITKESPDTTCLTLGGDHSVAIGTLAGHFASRPNTKIVWVDAHSDINPPLSSDSGNIHGMVLSFLVHELQHLMPKIPGFEWIKPCIHAKDITFIGLRDVDMAEKVIIERYGIKCYTMFDVDDMGINTIMKEVVSGFDNKTDNIHMSFDIDSLDPSLSPSTGTPVSGGLTLREGMYICEQLSSTGKLRCIDLVEVNTSLGNERDATMTVRSAGDIISACFSKRRIETVSPDFVLPTP